MKWISHKYSKSGFMALVPIALKPKRLSFEIRQPSASSEAPEGNASMPFCTIPKHEQRPEPEMKVKVQLPDKVFDSESKEEFDHEEKPVGSMTVRELQMLLVGQNPDMTVFFYDARMMAR
jgi:hypothetical protein